MVFVFCRRVFSDQETQNSLEGLWRIINKEYRTGCEPESRFWNPGDDPYSIIKIDKPHLSDNSVWDLITKNPWSITSKSHKVKLHTNMAHTSCLETQ